MKAAVALAIAALLGSAASAAEQESKLQETKVQETKLTVEPIVRLADGQIAACGVAFLGRYNEAAFAAEFVLKRSPVGPIFRLTGRYDGPEQLADIALETDFASTVGLMPRPRPKPDRTLEVEAGIPGYTGSEFVRSLMVAGGHLRLGLAGPRGNVVDIKIPGPFSQQIRASYLNCAGDLERP